MADGTITMNPGSGGNVLDTTLIAGTRHRERIQIAGANDVDLVAADAANGLDVDVTRVQGTVTTNVSNMIPAVETGLAKDATFAKDADGGIKTHVQNFPATQAVSGTVTANAGTGPWPVTDNGGSLTIDSSQLPTALQTNGGLKVEGVAGGVAVPVSGTFWQTTQPVSGTVTANAGTGTMNTDVSDRTARLLGHVTVDNSSLAVTGTFWQTTQPVSIATTVTTKQTTSSTGTTTSVASSASNVTLLASNTNRLGATVYNESTQVLYLKLGATASATSYTLQVAGGGYYEVPFSYTGQIDGIWASANGNARVTELT
jgi:hypothetical protein